MLIFPLIRKAATAVEFPTLASLEQRYRSDLGVSLSGSNVSAWADQSGNSRNLSEGTNQPLLVSGAGPNGVDVIRFDGTNDSLSNASFTAHANANKHVFMVMKQITWNSGDFIYRFASNNESLRQDGTTPTIQQDDGGTAGNDSSATLGTFFVVESFHDGATTSFTRLNNGSKSTGTDPGSVTASDGFYLGADNSKARNTNIDIAELVICSAEITGADLASVHAYFSDRYGLY